MANRLQGWGVAALLAVLAVLPARAAFIDYGTFSLEYDESTVFGDPFSPVSGGGEFSFAWSVPTSVKVVYPGGGGGPVFAFFDLPSFTLSANPGWTLRGPVTAVLGNLAFTEIGANAQTGARVDAEVVIDNSAFYSVGGVLARGVEDSGPGYSMGYYAGGRSGYYGDFSTLSFANGLLSLGAGGGRFASISGQPQNALSFSFLAVAAPVPEPAEWAMVLAGLGTVAWVAVRRRRNLA